MEGHDNRGHAYYNKGPYGNAISDFSKAIEIKNGLADGYLNMGAHDKKA